MGALGPIAVVAVGAAGTTAGVNYAVRTRSKIKAETAFNAREELEGDKKDPSFMSAEDTANYEDEVYAEVTKRALLEEAVVIPFNKLARNENVAKMDAIPAFVREEFVPVGYTGYTKPC